jgi:hypothetical protein
MDLVFKKKMKIKTYYKKTFGRQNVGKTTNLPTRLYLPDSPQQALGDRLV